jgi:hypothetical protein
MAPSEPAGDSLKASAAIRKKDRRGWREIYAARRFTLLSAMAVSFLSTAFSSSRFC